MKNVIVFLVRSNWRDIVDLNECLFSIVSNIPETLEGTDILFFHEADFHPYVDGIEIPESLVQKVKFVEIDLSVPSEFVTQERFNIPEFVPHPTHSNGPISFGHPGFSIGYRSMCRFFGAEVFNHQALIGYEYLMRLDTDSRFLKGNGDSLFSWASSNDITYSFVNSAVQWDHHKLIGGLKLNSVKYFAMQRNFSALIKSVFTRRGRVYYTNFEIAKIRFFMSDTWQGYFNYLDNTGGFYTKRWGDHILRYMGVNCLLPKKKRLPIPPGFTYQHGGIFESGDRQSLRPYFLSR